MPDEPTYRIEAISFTGAPADLSIRCDLCPWTAHIDRPMTLTELNRYVEAHTEERHQ